MTKNLIRLVVALVIIGVGIAAITGQFHQWMPKHTLRILTLEQSLDSVCLVSNTIDAIVEDKGPVKVSFIGTGFHIGDGIIITAFHTFSDGLGVTEVREPNDIKNSVKLLAIDPNNDIAILYCEAARSGCKESLILSDKPVKLGEPVSLIGFPLYNSFRYTKVVSRGIVSALTNHFVRGTPCILTDAIGDYGSSGSPLLSNGFVVGMLLEKYRDHFSCATQSSVILATLERYNRGELKDSVGSYFDASGCPRVRDTDVNKSKFSAPAKPKANRSR